MTVQEIAEELDVRPDTLRSWFKEDRPRDTSPPPAQGQLDAEVARLRRENRQLRVDLKIAQAAVGVLRGELLR